MSRRDLKVSCYVWAHLQEGRFVVWLVPTVEEVVACSYVRLVVCCLLDGEVVHHLASLSCNCLPQYTIDSFELEQCRVWKCKDLTLQSFEDSFKYTPGTYFWCSRAQQNQHS